ncbi:MAG: class I SAM-dependent methyltransferase [Bryobacteraceae bacterium]
MDWWRDHFSGMLADLWRSILPPEETASAAAFVIEGCGVAPGASILDVPCGEGRVALELGRRGYRVRGVDISANLLATASARAADEGLAVEWVQGDMREIAGKFDAVCCLGDSFGYMDEAGNGAFLRAVRQVLEPGARFALEMKMLAEVLFPRFQPRMSGKVGEMQVELLRSYDPRTGRMAVEYRIERAGEREVRHASYRIYSSSDVCRMLDAAGFGDMKLADAMGNHFALGSERLRLVARAR